MIQKNNNNQNNNYGTEELTVSTMDVGDLLDNLSENGDDDRLHYDNPMIQENPTAQTPVTQSAPTQLDPLMELKTTDLDLVSDSELLIKFVTGTDWN